MQFQSGKASFQRTRCPNHLYIFSNTAKKAVDEILAEGRQAKEFHPGTSWEEGFPNTTCQEGPKDKQDTSLLPLSLSEHSIACSVLEVGEFLSRQGGGKTAFHPSPAFLITNLSAHNRLFHCAARMVFCQAKYQPSSPASD